MTTSQQADTASPVDVAIGLLAFGSTLYFSSNAVLLLVLALLALTGKPRLGQRPELLLVFGFVGLALANLAAHLSDFDSARHASSPAVLLVAVAAALAPCMRLPAIRVFVLCVCVEVLVGCLEYATGKVALTSAQAGLAAQDLSLESELLYDLRVFGLSANSSLLAEKVFISALLTLSTPALFQRRWPALALMAVGYYISFNRTAIACTALFLLLLLMGQRLRWWHAFLGLVALTGLLAGAWAFREELLFQFTRGSGDELSYSELSRLYFWERSLATIIDDPLFGNGSRTFRVEDLVTGDPQHAHNSFLMIFATHGVIAPLLLLAYIVRLAHRDNWKMLVGFMAFSVTQYFVFWNLSVPDLFLFWLLRPRAFDQPPVPAVVSQPTPQAPSPA